MSPRVFPSGICVVWQDREILGPHNGSRRILGRKLFESSTDPKYVKLKLMCKTKAKYPQLRIQFRKFYLRMMTPRGSYLDRMRLKTKYQLCLNVFHLAVFQKMGKACTSLPHAMPDFICYSFSIRMILSVSVTTSSL